eukprot:COSAG05_NODE_1513_length_4667_cov_51.337785_4_plen_93_part_00
MRVVGLEYENTENGFASVGFFETPNPTVVYPQYHTSDDLLQFLSTNKIYLLSKATLASAIVFAVRRIWGTLRLPWTLYLDTPIPFPLVQCLL